MEENKDFPIQCVTLNPLYGTPAKLFITDILGLRNVLGSNSLFLYKTHAINNVEVLGLVTSIKRKDDSLVLNIDDGTGTIQCFCPLSLDSNHNTKSPIGKKDCSRLSISLQRRLFETADNSISLGDLILVTGLVKLALWSKHMYINNCRWKVLNKSDSDEVWLKSLQNRIALYHEVYDKSFSLDEKLQSATKSFFAKEAYAELCKLLEPLVNDFLSNNESTVVFFGYELLEISNIKEAVSQFRIKSDTNYDRVLSPHEWRFLTFNAIASLLHKQVVSGCVIKKKCLGHEIVTNMDQIDSRYYITAKCQVVRESVQEAIDHLKSTKQSLDANSVLQAFNNLEFNFIRSSKHGYAIVSLLLNLIL